MIEVRKATNRILEMIEEGLLSPVSVVTMCLKWMGEDDVRDMAEANEIYFDDEEEYEEDEEEIEIDTLYHDFSEAELRKMGVFGGEPDSNDYVINVGDTRFAMEPVDSAATKAGAIAKAQEFAKAHRCVDVVFMPEDDIDTNDIVYSWYRD